MCSPGKPKQAFMGQAANACLGHMRDGTATVRRSEAGCLCLALTLAALIRWELMPPLVPAAPAALAGPAVSSPALSPGATREERAAVVSSILRRPLFRAGRRPAPAAVPDPPPPLPRLSGIVVTASARRAIFAGGKEGKPVVAAEGETLGPVKVARISAREVVVTGPDGACVLRPAAQSASEQAPLVPRQPGNAVSAAGATFGAIPTDRLALLRAQQAASVRRLRTAP